MRATILVVLTATAACRASAPIDRGPRYIVAAAPLDVGIVALCVAIDPEVPDGIWHWEPGRSGCSSRSTGPRVFRADEAVVSRPSADTIEARFRLQIIRAPQSVEARFVTVRIVVRDGEMHAPSGARVGTVHRGDLDVPESWR